MRVFGSRLYRGVKLGLVPCFALALIIGCESGGPGVGVSEPPKEGQVTAPKVTPPTAAEKRKLKGGARAASGTQPFEP